MAKAFADCKAIPSPQSCDSVARAEATVSEVRLVKRWVAVRMEGRQGGGQQGELVSESEVGSKAKVG